MAGDIMVIKSEGLLWIITLAAIGYFGMENNNLNSNGNMFVFVDLDLRYLQCFLIKKYICTENHLYPIPNLQL